MFERGIRADGSTVPFWRRWLDKGTGCGSYWPTTETPYRLYAEMQREVCEAGCLPPYELIGCNPGDGERNCRARVGMYMEALDNAANNIRDPFGLSRGDKGFPYGTVCRDGPGPSCVPSETDEWWIGWLDGNTPSPRVTHKDAP